MQKVGRRPENPSRNLEENPQSHASGIARPAAMQLELATETWTAAPRQGN